MFEMDNHHCFYVSSPVRFQSKKISPVIISIPHDSITHDSDWEGILSFREKGIVGRDKHTWPIVRDILSSTNKVSVVRGIFPRSVIDYNRSQSDSDSPAWTDPRMQHFFSYYHSAIAAFIEKAQSIFEKHKCLLLDIHGFCTQPFKEMDFDIILGTRNKETIKFNSDIDDRLAFFLKSRGYRVFVPQEEKVPNEKYSGAFTIQYHSEKSEISAIQVEIAKKFRVKQGKEIGVRLSKDLADFIEENF